MKNATGRRLSLIYVMGISALMFPLILAAASPKYKYMHEPDPLMHESAKCPKNNQVQIPISDVGSHNYVLLLVFDNDANADKAGQDLFNADPGLGKPRTTFGCMHDPALAATTLEDNIMLKVKGCPSDCFGPMFAGYRDKSKGGNVSPATDPLWYADPTGHTVNWGIFFADADSDGKSDSQVRVWQIRVADASHAHEILASIKDKLKIGYGYMGNLLVGYQPMHNEMHKK